MTMITIRKELHRDVAAREALLDRAFGDARFARRPSGCAKTACRRKASPSRAAQAGRVVGTARLWNVGCRPGTPALLLGPLAVIRGLPLAAASAPT